VITHGVCEKVLRLRADVVTVRRLAKPLDLAKSCSSLKIAFTGLAPTPHYKVVVCNPCGRAETQIDFISPGGKISISIQLIVLGFESAFQANGPSARRPIGQITLGMRFARKVLDEGASEAPENRLQGRKEGCTPAEKVRLSKLRPPLRRTSKWTLLGTSKPGLSAVRVARSYDQQFSRLPGRRKQSPQISTLQAGKEQTDQRPKIQRELHTTGLFRQIPDQGKGVFEAGSPAQPYAEGSRTIFARKIPSLTPGVYEGGRAR